ncbi:MAG: radical SAM protein [Synergistaceae bacterium]|jgi:radical SAM superfamily enzyme with C-terminal helix-hairpin-helix motif|nr:radical SAM protein [Synergistaceae bacterium]
MKSLILDGYVDEPACFGVPPYVSPYVRYCAGVFFSHGHDVSYAACDQWREARREIDEIIASSDIVVVIMGLTVPGRYRGGSPLTLRELREISGIRRKGVLMVGGPVRNGYALRGGARAQKIRIDGVDFAAEGDPEASLDIYCRTGEWISDAVRSYDWLDGSRNIASLGAGILRSHPSYPDVMMEMELSRGCDRAAGLSVRCSFCAEGTGAGYEERGVEGVAREISALAEAGAAAFRLGRAANILAYGGELTASGFRPNPSRIEELYSGIRRIARNLSVLHTDNCNPATIARFPGESAACIDAIARYNTEGDGLSLGIENLDPEARRANNLKVSMEEALMAVRLINDVGGARRAPCSLPSLLPGLNFLFGLAGESGQGMAWNTKFLETLLDEGLAVRRINIRRAMVFPGLGLEYALAANPSRLKERDYSRWKRWVREEVDPVMLERVAPDGTLLRDVITERRVGNVVFGRQIGSYPPLVGIVSGSLGAREKVDVMVTGRGGRSLTAVRRPLDINSAALPELMALPEIGRARAERLMSCAPYGSIDDIKKSLSQLDSPGIEERLAKYFSV